MSERLDELQRLERVFVECAAAIAKRQQAGQGSGWFNPTSWEMTLVDCEQAARVARQIAALLVGVK